MYIYPFIHKHIYIYTHMDAAVMFNDNFLSSLNIVCSLVSSSAHTHWEISLACSLITVRVAGGQLMAPHQCVSENKTKGSSFSFCHPACCVRGDM